MGGNAMWAGGGGEGAIFDRSSAGTGWTLMLQSKKEVRRKERMEPMEDNWEEKVREGEEIQTWLTQTVYNRDCLL